MAVFKRAFAVALLVLLGSVGRSVAVETAESLAVRLYKSLETAARNDFTEAVKQGDVLAKQRAKAGKVVLTPALERQALAALQLMFYSKYAAHGVCAIEVASRDIEKAAGEIQVCYKKRMADLAKWMKLTDYAQSMSAEKMTRCEVSSRDFDNELRFPPFDFLIGDQAPALFDFSKFSACIQNSL